MSKSKFQPSYDSGHLPVGDGHVLYYELWGNPKGTPVLFFHGGPGSGFTEKHKAFFDPQKHNVIFFDQRGAGRSTPFASIEHNTTQDLISDTKKLLEHLDVKKVYVFGGSWGSTMALLFAIECPQMVTGLLLRGIFLGIKDELVSYYYPGDAIRYFFPEVWERFIDLVPENERANTVNYYFEKMREEGPDQDKYLYEWCLYESCVLSIDHNIADTEKEMRMDDEYKAVSILEAHYFVNNCFLEDNYILNNIEKIQHIPTTIIQGRYDVVCPPKYAYELHKALKGSALYFTKAGHHGSDSATKKKLIEEMSKIG